MTPRFKVALAVLGALVLATGALWIVLGGSTSRKGTKPAEVAQSGRSTPGRGTTPTRAGDGTTRLEGNPTGVTPGDATEEDDPRPGIRPGLRVPSGEDLSDPKVVRDYLQKFLSQADIKREDWKEVKNLFAILQEPLSPELRARVLEEIRIGNRVGVLDALTVLHDPSFTPDLLRMMDESTLTPQAKTAAVLALQTMPGLDPAEVVRGLEARITGDIANDHALLQAIAVRGGREGARALVQYVQASTEPGRIQAYVLRNLDLRSDPDAARVIAAAISEEQSPATMKALLEMAGRPGAAVLVQPLIALDREGVPDEVREQAIESLARIGTEEAVDRLLLLANEPGKRGDMALRKLGDVGDPTPQALDKLTMALERTGRGAQGARIRQQLLLTLGSARHVAAMPLMADALKDPATEVRLAAVRGIGRLESAAEAYVPNLVTLYADGDEAMKRHVVLALGNIGGDTARRTLLQIQGDPSLPPGMKRTVDMALTAATANTPIAPRETPTLGGNPSPPK